MPAPFEFVSYGHSDVGLVRDNNEDAYARMDDYAFFALADGMGGHRAGEIAANKAIQFICRSVEELFTTASKNWEAKELSDYLCVCIENANRWIHHLSNRYDQYSGMGTTLSTFFLYKEFIIYGHVGDSRIYRFRNNHLQQLTYDHSLLNELYLQGKECTEQESQQYNNILTRSIGSTNTICPEIGIEKVCVGDIYFLCSDGLTDHVNDMEITRLLIKYPSPKNSTHALVDLAKAKGGKDNITVVTVHVEPCLTLTN